MRCACGFVHSFRVALFFFLGGGFGTHEPREESNPETTENQLLLWCLDQGGIEPGSREEAKSTLGAGNVGAPEKVALVERTDSDVERLDV